MLPTPTTTSRTNDDIHTSINLDPLTLAFLDTPQLQRLRGLNQLGVADYVYMNARHSRFEHSLGVAHLAETMASSLARRQPSLKITEKDIMCIKLAGLCHDLGHGPFSHIYDGELREQLKVQGRGRATETPPKKRKAGTPPFPDYKSHTVSGLGTDPDSFAVENENWHHEDASLTMLDSLLQHLGLSCNEEDLDSHLKQVSDGYNAMTFGITKADGTMDVLTTRDIIFIKECIMGGPLKGKTKFKGRGTEKEFLYDIVSNRHSGLDVDKMDYYARDQKRTLGTGKVDVMLIEEAFVAKGVCSRPDKCHSCDPENPKEHYMICYPEKLIVKAMEFFKTRFSMHSNVYTHKTVKAVEYMVCDALVAADPFIPIPTGVPGGATRISQAMVDPSAYVNLKDSVLDMIECSTDRDTEPARALVRRIRQRDLYKCLLTVHINQDELPLWVMKEEEIKGEVCRMGEKIVRETWETAAEEERVDEEDLIKLMPKPSDMIVEKRLIHHGQKELNPVNNMRFLGKQKLGELKNKLEMLPLAKRKDESAYDAHIPKKFAEKMIRIYAREHAMGPILLSASKELAKRYQRSATHQTCLSPVPAYQKRAGWNLKRNTPPMATTKAISQDLTECSAPLESPPCMDMILSQGSVDEFEIKGSVPKRGGKSSKTRLFQSPDNTTGTSTSNGAYKTSANGSISREPKRQKKLELT